MKKLVAIFVLASFVGSTTELHEFLKLPSMLVHYREHVLNDGPIGFAEFIHIHYSSDIQHEDTDGDEEPLPFHSQHCTLTVIAPVKEINDIGCEKIIITPRIIQLPNSGDHFISSDYSGNIWQPPKA